MLAFDLGDWSQIPAQPGWD